MRFGAQILNQWALLSGQGVHHFLLVSSRNVQYCGQTFCGNFENTSNNEFVICCFVLLCLSFSLSLFEFLSIMCTYINGYTYRNRECPGGRLNPWIAFKWVLSCKPSVKHWPHTWQQYCLCCGIWTFLMWYCSAFIVLPAYLHPLIEHFKVFWPWDSKCSLRQCVVLNPFWHTGHWCDVTVLCRKWMWCCSLEGPLHVKSQCGHLRVLMCLLTCSRRSLSVG